MSFRLLDDDAPLQERISGIAPLSELTSIQVLRGLAALAVVAEHLNREFDAKLQVLNPLPPIFKSLGSIGVDLFFVISGFIMVYVSASQFGRTGATRHFFLRRCIRIVPLYWAVTSILLVYIVLRYPSLASANHSIASVVASFLFFPYPAMDGSFFPVAGVGWTLNYEMFFYLVFSIALVATCRVAVTGITIVFVAMAWLNTMVGPLSYPLSFWSNPIILQFVFGMWVGLALVEGMKLPVWVSKVLVAGALAVAAGELTAAGSTPIAMTWPAWLLWGLPSTFVIAGLTLARTQQMESALWVPLIFLGDASYALYLTHPIALTLPRWLFSTWIDPVSSPYLYCALAISTAIVVASFVHLAFERPVTRWLQSFLVRSAPSR